MIYILYVYFLYMSKILDMSIYKERLRQNFIRFISLFLIWQRRRNEMSILLKFICFLITLLREVYLGYSYKISNSLWSQALINKEHYLFQILLVFTELRGAYMFQALMMFDDNIYLVISLTLRKIGSHISSKQKEWLSLSFVEDILVVFVYNRSNGNAPSV